MRNQGLAIAACAIVLASMGVGRAQQTTKQDTLKELMRRINIITEELERAKLGKVAEPGYESKFGMGPAASKVYSLSKNGVSLAGYGEVVYNNFAQDADNGTPAVSKDRIDYLRHVIYLGYRFNDWLLFNSELEFEHAKAGEGAAGEVAVEFGYVEAAITPAVNLRAGMVLIPMGIINELHEPPTFQGALRPETERRIIPATWRANGFGVVGAANALEYKLYVTESLDAASFSSDGIRSGRQEGSEAVAEDFALSGRLSYTGVNGLNLGGSFFIGNSGQGMVDSTGVGIDARVSLVSAHFLFARRGLEVRGLYARSTIDDVSRLDAALGLSGARSIGETQSGGYITLAYDIMPLLSPTTTHYLAPFVQYEKLNTQDDVPAGFSSNPARERTNVTVGLKYKPHPNVALKLDYVNRDNEANSAVDQFNVAINYLF